MIALLNKKIAQMEKDLEDKDVALQRLKKATQTIPDDEEVRNNQIGVWCKEKENQDDNQGVEEKDEDEEANLEIANFWKENNKEEKRWKETITKQEQRCDLLTDVIQQQHQVKASLVDSLFQKTVSPFTNEVDSYHLLEKFKVPNVLIYTGLRDPVEHLDSF